MKTVLFLIFLLVHVSVRADGIEFMSVDNVVRSAAKLHHTTIQVRGVIYIEERAILLSHVNSFRDSGLHGAIMLNTRSRPLQKDPKWVSLLRDREEYLKRRREAGVTGWIPYEAEVVLEGYFEDAESLPFKTDENGDLYQLTNPYWGCSYLLTIDHVVGFHPLPDLPNQALEPTSTSVTDPADAGSAPAVVVAHLER